MLIVRNVNSKLVKMDCGDPASVLGKCRILERGYAGFGWNTNVY